MKKKLRILITGASRGIGFAVAKRITKYAETLIITAKQKSSLIKCETIIRETYKGNLYKYAIDHSSGERAAHELASWIKQTISSIDIIVLCAGNYFEGDLCTIDPNEFENTLQTNFLFNYYFIRNIVDIIRPNIYPRIIIIGSTAAYSAYSVPTYGVAKWALRGLAVNLRKELMKNHIGVTFISPGPVLTDMWADVEVPKGRILEPDDIAKVICNTLELSAQAVVEELIIQPMEGDYDE